MYNATGRSKDCGGHGICLWNMAKGNHCKCDKGFFLVEKCMRRCESRRECCGKCTYTNETKYNETKYNETKEKAFIQGYVAGHKSNSTSEVESLTMRPDMGEGASHTGFLKEYRTSLADSMTSTKQYSLYGWHFVSKRCKDLEIGECTNKIGCENFSEWRCSVEKKTLDYVISKRMSPVDIAAQLDQYCGKFLLEQEKKKRKLCYSGVRMGEQCGEDSDCPASPAE